MECDNVITYSIYGVLACLLAISEILGVVGKIEANSLVHLVCIGVERVIGNGRGGQELEEGLLD
jgi:hypothetical protein